MFTSTEKFNVSLILTVTMPTKRVVTTTTSRPAKKRRYNGKAGYTRTTGYYGRFAGSNAEKKFYDTSISSTTVGSGGNILLSSVCTIPQGTGESARIGRKVTLRALNFRFVVTLPNTTLASATDDGVRVIVYHDKQCNGATASVTDILESADYLSFNNLANKDRFKILSDKVVDISATAGAYTGTNDTWGDRGVTRSVYLKLNQPVEFSSTTGVISEIRSNNIGILAVTDAGRIKLEGRIRVRYTDL